MISAIILQWDKYGELIDHEYMVLENDEKQVKKLQEMIYEAYIQRRDFSVEFLKRSD